MTVRLDGLREFDSTKDNWKLPQNRVLKLGLCVCVCVCVRERERDYYILQQAIHGGKAIIIFKVASEEEDCFSMASQYPVFVRGMDGKTFCFSATNEWRIVDIKAALQVLFSPMHTTCGAERLKCAFLLCFDAFQGWINGR